VVERAMAERPEDRYPTASELSEALAGADLPLPEPPRGRRRVALAAAAALAAAGLWAGLTPQGNALLARGRGLVRSVAGPVLGDEAVTSKGVLPGHDH
jgi:hypothetical protein